MSFTTTEEQKKAVVITTALFALLLLILIFIKFATATKIQELAGGGGGGITINFGDSDVGMGEDFRSEVLQVSNSPASAPQATVEDILTNDADDAVAIAPTAKPQKPTVAKPTTVPVPAKPTPSKSTTDALNSILGGSNKGGDGDDGVAGNKGKSTGDKNSGGYYGDGGTGGGTGGGNGTGNGPGSGSGNGPGSGGGTGGGYSLGSRKPLEMPSPKYVCDEVGKVVVEVWVDRNGKTINAITGIKGTTNTAKCLADQAKSAAMRTRWSADQGAPERQVGKIVYTFSLN